MTAVLLYIFIYLAFAVLAVMISHKLGLGSVLGYLLAGIMIGPMLGLVGEETESIQHVAEFGVVMMLFLVGLELAPQKLWRLRHNLLGLGGLQVLLTLIAIAAGAIAFGYSWKIGVAIGAILTLSSTAIVLQTFMEKNLFDTQGGQAGFAVLLFQDVAAIPMLALLPLLSAARLRPENIDSALNLLANKPKWMLALASVGVIAAIIVCVRYLVPFALSFFSRRHLHEMFSLFTLALVIGIAALMTMIGLSPALGAFIAGVALANSTYRHELESHLEPFKGLLLGLFFITVGAGMNFALLKAELGIIIALTLAVMTGKAVILWLLGRLFRFPPISRNLLALSLAQAGEFGFVLLAIARQNYVLPTALADRIALVVALTMLLTPLLFVLYDKVLAVRNYSDDQRKRPADTINERNPVILLGHGRFGQEVNNMLTACGFKTTVIDHHIDTVNHLNKYGIKTYYGDATRPELLSTIGLERAKLLIVAIGDRQHTTEIVAYVHRNYPQLPVIARAHERTHAYDLLRVGATYIIRDTTDAAIHSGRIALERLGFSSGKALQMSEFYAARERHQLHEIADLYDHDVPLYANEELIAQSRKMDLETYRLMHALIRGDEVDWQETPEEYHPSFRTSKQNHPLKKASGEW